MLLQRVLTAIPLALAVIWLILFQPTEIFVYLLLFIAFVAAYEWSRLSGSQSRFFNIIYAFVIMSFSYFLIMMLALYIEWYVYASVIFWLVISLRLKSIRPDNEIKTMSLQKIILGLLIIPAAVISMWAVHKSSNGELWLMYGLALIWVADIGAYFSGKKFGKNKLAEFISPGKTIEGFTGALVLTSFYTLCSGYYFELTLVQVVILLVVSLFLTFISVVGDLYESVLKREAGLKDSGNILPGHGGMLDRIDSVLAAMPVFSVALHYSIQPVFELL